MHCCSVSGVSKGGTAVNVKRVYRVMKAHGLLLERHTGNGEERRHDGRVAVDRPDTRWCSDGFEPECPRPAPPARPRVRSAHQSRAELGPLTSSSDPKADTC